STSVRSTAIGGGVYSGAAFAARWRERRRERLRLAERFDGLRLHRRLAERTHLPERLERLLAVAARLPEARRADRADEEAHLDLGAADRAMHVAARQALLHRLDLELALAHVLEVLGRPEEHVDQRADEGRDQPEHGRYPDEPRIFDPPPRVLEDPERRRQPEDCDEEQRQVADHGPRAVAEEAEESVCCNWGHARLLEEELPDEVPGAEREADDRQDDDDGNREDAQTLAELPHGTRCRRTVRSASR